MEKQNDSIRERLLARLPQPGNIAAYREETTALLAKHEKALFWEKMPSAVLFVGAIVVMAEAVWSQKPGAAPNQFFWLWTFFFLAASVLDLRYRIYRSKVDLLKEVKQTQLQLLELQASLLKDASR